MEEDNYYSKAFLAPIHPSNGIYGFDSVDFQKALDTLFRMSDWMNGKKNFQKPMNIIVGKKSKSIILGINFDKAVLGFNSLNVIIEGLKDEKAEEQIKKVSVDEFGFQINTFLELNFDIFSQIFDDLLDKFKDYNYAIKHNTGIFAYTISDNEKICIRAIQKGMNKNNSIYGGNGMWINPIFKAKDISPDPNLCFCVLPFNKMRLEIFDEVLRPMLENNWGITVVRSGNILRPNLNIMESVWTSINQAAFIIADLSDKNPNVFYELGICHTLGKPVITLCDEESYKNDYNEKLPFDINSINTIFYKNTGAGPTKLVNEINKNITAIRSGKPYIK
ncbi:hypothetical protein DF212_00105 [Lactobacillus johnsonii]|nr:hypothetical protein DF212_00105 [Lactobacillus johnsonii]